MFPLLVLHTEELVAIVKIRADLAVVQRELPLLDLLLLLVEIVSEVHNLRLAVSVVDRRIELYHFLKIAVDSAVDDLGAQHLPVLARVVEAATALQLAVNIAFLRS